MYIKFRKIKIHFNNNNLFLGFDNHMKNIKFQNKQEIEIEFVSFSSLKENFFNKDDAYKFIARFKRFIECYKDYFKE